MQDCDRAEPAGQATRVLQDTACLPDRWTHFQPKSNVTEAMNDDASRQRMDTATRQQPRMQQYDSQYQDTYSSYQPQQPQYDNRESPVNARRQQQHQIQYQQQQQHQRQEHDRRYDTAHRDDYAKGQVDMREVSRYPPVQQQQYGHPAAHGYYGGGDNDGRLQPQNARTSSGPAYAPAPVATASMADLRDSLTASTTTSDGKPAKKPKRVYETAFGHFSWSDLLKRKYWKYYAILLVIGILVLLAVIFHDDIITWMQPVAEKIRDIPGGWAIWV